MFERFTGRARMAVVAAQEQARATKSPRIEAVHVFLGVLDTADSGLRSLLEREGYTVDSVRATLSTDSELGDGDAKALESIGIDLDAVRASLEASFGEGALDEPTQDKRGWLGRRTGHLAFAPASKKAIELSLREAIQRKDSEIRSEHLLLGLIRGADDGFTAVVRDPDGLRNRITESLDKAA
ncbi:Clp protease N-terminal domain-containing protein [Rhodococcoides kyotonense]|uniref:Clp amino terminal domain-containing protein, pathogenicity island component n=1 Tax=Rhodococcoides kyotonense TaxID=398843 RepID=A0A239M6A1_9NOCA|nr:Clp protease N-terminal domain-containing protein [Rhodococcus kyotonensis]SNT37678.1 Clp amino terminal domain-containing protein, pathogenicity island component [Rhodococcus kyotonensis]